MEHNVRSIVRARGDASADAVLKKFTLQKHASQPRNRINTLVYCTPPRTQRPVRYMTPLEGAADRAQSPCPPPCKFKYTLY